VAFSVTVADEAVARVVMVNVVVALPAGTVTEAGTPAELLLLERTTRMPPLGAALVKVIVPSEETPAGTLAGLRDTDDNALDAVKVRAAVLLTLLKVAVIVAFAAALPTVVVTVKVAVVLPAATVTVAGTIAAVLLLDRATETPPLGAALLKVTVPVELAPPVTVAGFRETDESAVDAVIVRPAVLLRPL
jgi:hypothetical protein